MASLQSALVWNRLRQLAPGVRPLRVVVAWSGGLDSTVLVHLMQALRAAHPGQIDLRAVHVDHHLQAASAVFRSHCLRVARRWRLKLSILDARVTAIRGASVEEAARNARYACWRSELRPGELLLTAQHADDQLETTMLALLRGAGPAGLAAMPATSTLGAGSLLRPLLEWRRADLEEYARRAGLPVVEDPSNAQPRFDRNFLRLQVLPVLRQRWPGAATTVARSAGHCARAAAVQLLHASRDLDAAADGAGIELAVLRRWPEDRALAVLRAWFARNGLRSPETRHLQEIRRMGLARSDAHPRLDLPQASLRVHAGRLLLHPPITSSDAPGTAPVTRPDARLEWQWRRGPLKLPDGRSLSVRRDRHGDLDLQALPHKVFVHFPGSAPARGRTLRKLLQSLELPPWERGLVPLLYPADDSGRLLAVGDLWLHERLQRVSGTDRGRIVWRAKD